MLYWLPETPAVNNISIYVCTKVSYSRKIDLPSRSRWKLENTLDLPSRHDIWISLETGNGIWNLESGICLHSFSRANKEEKSQNSRVSVITNQSRTILQESHPNLATSKFYDRPSILSCQSERHFPQRCCVIINTIYSSKQQQSNNLFYR